ncbi:MAG: hypothetical protein MUP98_10585 [Candidatus Aminicenantes bacterium]|nr:hypothetical protein [Candidatus Aminicenantes bacterium]
MKKTIIFIIFFCVMSAPISWSKTETGKDKDISKQVVELKQQIKKLENRIESLEKQLRLLDQKVSKTPHIYPRFKNLPKGWKEYEYEGLKYYLVPLADETKKKRI